MNVCLGRHVLAFTSISPAVKQHAARLDKAHKVILKNFSFEEMEDWCVNIGEKPSRALHLWRWLYDDDRWITGFRQTAGQQDGFSKHFVQKAEQLATCHGGIHLQDLRQSSDGTTKLLFALDDLPGAQVETVLIPVVRKQVRSDYINTYGLVLRNELLSRLLPSFNLKAILQMK
jgi:hypothetical protein